MPVYNGGCDFCGASSQVIGEVHHDIKHQLAILEMQIEKLEQK